MSIRGAVFVCQGILYIEKQGLFRVNTCILTGEFKSTSAIQSRNDVIDFFCPF